METKEELIARLKLTLKTYKKEQVTDIYAPFTARLDRYVKIKLIRYILNSLTTWTIITKSKN